MMYTIKRLGIESFDSILNLEKLCFPAPDRWKEEDWRMLLERDRDIYYAMTDGDRLIGNVFICNWLGERDYVKVMNVSVHPDYRKQGIARRLLNRVTEDMTKLGMYRFCDPPTKPCSKPLKNAAISWTGLRSIISTILTKAPGNMC